MGCYYVMLYVPGYNGLLFQGVSMESQILTNFQLSWSSWEAATGETPACWSWRGWSRSSSTEIRLPRTPSRLGTCPGGSVSNIMDFFPVFLLPQIGIWRDKEGRLHWESLHLTSSTLPGPSPHCHQTSMSWEMSQYSDKWRSNPRHPLCGIIWIMLGWSLRQETPIDAKCLLYL